MIEPRAPFADKPTLVGEKVLLRPVRPQEDLPLLRVLLQDAEILRWTSGSWTPAVPDWDEALERRTIDRYRTRNDRTDCLDLIVVDRSTGRGVGEIGLDEWDEPGNSCTLRIALGPDGRDRGLGPEAIRLLTDHAFRVLGLHRVSLSVHRLNSRCHVFQKAGFRVEGVRRRALPFNGRWVDRVEMAALAEDWGHELPPGPDPERPAGVLEDDPERRLTDAEWTRLRDYLRRYVVHELDQWECWRIDTAHGPIAMTLSNAFREDDHPGAWRAI
ncbi:GNAT family N-acetyltransferase [Kitasatospora sp. NPDC059673]|uniref:GNAT family N-acetyltransferase n=1 Tax=Kitasatospora sp. NPDC059673 TaxID=3346901 RepID=UPI0036B4E123